MEANLTDIKLAKKCARAQGWKKKYMHTIGDIECYEWFTKEGQPTTYTVLGSCIDTESAYNPACNEQQSVELAEWWKKQSDFREVRVFFEGFHEPTVRVVCIKLTSSFCEHCTSMYNKSWSARELTMSRAIVLAVLSAVGKIKR